jgi:glucose-1-phosphate cytidylyltransferase
MKVVLFCGGLGTRIREYPEPVPKPMITIGPRPILWHVMKYYAHYGYKDFILCLGYKADVVKDYFLNYNECISNNFTMSNGGKTLRLQNSDIHDWSITCIDTGFNANVGQRLKAVESYLEGESVFLANYSDGLTDLRLSDYVGHFLARDKIGSFLAVRPPYTSHIVSFEDDVVTGVGPISKAGLSINGGFFIFRTEIFEYMNEGEELVDEPFARLIQEQRLMAYKYQGYWTCMDTFKDRQNLDDLYNGGQAPWEVWKSTQMAGDQASWQEWQAERGKKTLSARARGNGHPNSKTHEVRIRGRINER